MCKDTAVFSFKDTGSSILKVTEFVSLELKKKRIIGKVLKRATEISFSLSTTVNDNTQKDRLREKKTHVNHYMTLFI